MSQDKYQLAENVLFQKVAEETVILEPETGEYYTLNAVGTFIVEQFQQGYFTEKVVNLVLENYEATEQEVRQDIDELINQLIKQGLFVKNTDTNG